jgi:hypothetical protein
MMIRLRTAFAILALCLAGCTPLVLSSSRPHFATSEYTLALADGKYAVDDNPMKLATIANRSGQVEITLDTDDEAPAMLVGGFIALKTPGHFIFQVTGTIENGVPAPPNPEDGSVYIPVRIASTGEVNWYFEPKMECDINCVALLSSYGFLRPLNTSWVRPKNLSRTAMLAFYEELAVLLEKSPDNWETLRIMRVAG